MKYGMSSASAGSRASGSAVMQGGTHGTGSLATRTQH